jgi:hypothetical protein
MYFILKIRVFWKWPLECNTSIKFSWDPYRSNGLNLNRVSLFLFFENLTDFHYLVLTQMRIGDLVFKRGITQCDTLKGLDFDAWLMPEGICDTCATLVTTKAIFLVTYKLILSM